MPDQTSSKRKYHREAKFVEQEKEVAVPPAIFIKKVLPGNQSGVGGCCIVPA